MWLSSHMKFSSGKFYFEPSYMQVTANFTSVFKVWSAESAELIPSHWLGPMNGDALKLQDTTELFHFLVSSPHNFFLMRLSCIIPDPLPTDWTCFCLVYMNKSARVAYSRNSRHQQLLSEHIH